MLVNLKLGMTRHNLHFSHHIGALCYNMRLQVLRLQSLHFLQRELSEK